MTPPTPIENVTIVGGGDAGKLTSLIFKQGNPTLNVRIIDDLTKPPKNVGKSTFSSITWVLHNKLNIDIDEFVQEVNPVWKHSVYLEDWTGSEFFTPFDIKNLMDSADKTLEDVHHRYQTDNFTTINKQGTLDAKTPFVGLGEEDIHWNPYPHVAYHLDVRKFNSFLNKLINRREIKIVDDRITSVNMENHMIKSIEGENRSYEADLYIDATGFKRVLASATSISFTEYDLPLDSALVTQIPITLEDIVPATVVRTLENGWTWQIDTTDSRDLGYVYASSYTTPKAAERAFRDKFGMPESVDISSYSFSSGKFDQAWAGNCLLAGDAYGFVEPLQSTSLSIHAHIMCDIVDYLEDHSWLMNKGLHSIVNNLANAYWKEIYDFLSIFYKYSKGESNFWKDAKYINNTEKWDEYDEEYKDGGGFLLPKAKWTEGLSFGKVFNIYQSDYTMYQLGVPIKIHEENSIEVSSATKNRIDMKTKKVRETSDKLLTYPELYSPKYIGNPSKVDPN